MKERIEIQIRSHWAYPLFDEMAQDNPNVYFTYTVDVDNRWGNAGLWIRFGQTKHRELSVSRTFNVNYYKGLEALIDSIFEELLISCMAQAVTLETIKGVKMKK